MKLSSHPTSGRFFLLAGTPVSCSSQVLLGPAFFFVACRVSSQVYMEGTQGRQVCVGGGGVACSASLLFGMAGVTPAGTPRLLPTGLNSSMDSGALGSLIRAVWSLFQLTIALFCSRAPTCNRLSDPPPLPFPTR